MEEFRANSGSCNNLVIGSAAKPLWMNDLAKADSQTRGGGVGRLWKRLTAFPHDEDNRRRHRYLSPSDSPTESGPHETSPLPRSRGAHRPRLHAAPPRAGLQEAGHLP